MPTIVHCHGGCFGGGSPNYDKELKTRLTGYGFSVKSAKFPLDKGLEAAVDAVQKFASKFRDDELILLGVSSGGLIAHHAANCLKCPALLIAPVGQPFTRHSELPEKLAKLQLKFFGTKAAIKEAEYHLPYANSYRIMLFGRDDKRAPKYPWTKVRNTMTKLTSLKDKDHGYMCKSLSPFFVGTCAETLLQDAYGSTFRMKEDEK
jgi:hypothetical protein